MKTAYPAIVHEEDGSFWVEFPDLEGCFSDGETMADAISNAADALGGYLCSLMDRGIVAPVASDAKEINADGSQSVIKIGVDLCLDLWLSVLAHQILPGGIIHRFSMCLFRPGGVETS